MAFPEGEKAGFRECLKTSAVESGFREKGFHRGKDRYGRTIGEVFTPDGQQVEVAMVRLGFAWHYVKYAPRNTDLAGAELVARKARRGLWSDAAPVPPWEFRKR